MFNMLVLKWLVLESFLVVLHLAFVSLFHEGSIYRYEQLYAGVWIPINNVQQLYKVLFFVFFPFSKY